MVEAQQASFKMCLKKRSTESRFSGEVMIFFYLNGLGSPNCAQFKTSQFNFLNLWTIVLYWKTVNVSAGLSAQRENRLHPLLNAPFSGHAHNPSIMEHTVTLSVLILGFMFIEDSVRQVTRMLCQRFPKEISRSTVLIHNLLEIAQLN